jgi:hypothetical protein
LVHSTEARTSTWYTVQRRGPVLGTQYRGEDQYLHQYKYGNWQYFALGLLNNMYVYTLTFLLVLNNATMEYYLICELTLSKAK